MVVSLFSLDMCDGLWSVKFKWITCLIKADASIRQLQSLAYDNICHIIDDQVVLIHLFLRSLSYERDQYLVGYISI